jgi:Tfp pilus assembly protein PilN
VRPINLIPEVEQRRARGAGSRSGSMPFLLVGALVLALIGVVMLIHYSNQVSGREADLTGLQNEKTVATARAEANAPYTSFAAVTQQRTDTIAELANQRFDWPRVIRQLSLVLPSDVYFTSFSASSGGGGTEGEAGIAGPSMAIGGCASSQDAVAGFVATLKQIDGVTRVSLQNSTRNESKEGEVSGASSCASGGQTQFSVVVAFDFAPSSPDGLLEAAPETESSTESGGESSESESSTESEGSSESESEGGESTSGQSASTAEGGDAG